jgi:hypothetical protein
VPRPPKNSWKPQDPPPGEGAAKKRDGEDDD